MIAFIAELAVWLFIVALYFIAAVRGWNATDGWPLRF
jgi:hypothetical protein